MTMQIDGKESAQSWRMYLKLRCAVVVAATIEV